MVHDVEAKVGQVGALDAVGGVAIGAFRQLLLGARDLRAVKLETNISKMPRGLRAGGGDSRAFTLDLGRLAGIS